MAPLNIRVRFSNNDDLQPPLFDPLLALINRVYFEAEGFLFQPGTQRITAEPLKALLEKRIILLAEVKNEIVGCIHLKQFDAQTAGFGLLVADTRYHGKGIGRALVNEAEQWAIKQGCSIMQLELLCPKHSEPAQKTFLKTWYTRLGYIKGERIPFFNEASLIVPCDFISYQKQLSKK